MTHRLVGFLKSWLEARGLADANSLVTGCSWDIDAVRREFPALHQRVGEFPLAYLDNAATTQKPRAVIDAIRGFYERDNANVHRAVHELAHRATSAFESSRAAVARFINASTSEQVVFTRGATEAINLVAQSWGGSHLQKGDRILLTPMEHHSNWVPWQQIARRVGAHLEFIPMDPSQGTLQLDTLEALLAPPTRILSLTHVSNVLGTVNPVAEIVARARRRGVVTLVDAAQSIGHRPVDVQSIQSDFLVFSGHKMCGPMGVGVLWGRSEILKSMEPWQGGGEMVREVTRDGFTYGPPPQRFEAGTPPVAEAVGLRAAIEFIERQGRDAIRRYESELTRDACERLRAIPQLRILGAMSNRAPVISWIQEGIHPHDLVSFANERGVALRSGHHCAQPLFECLGVSGAVRASFAFYNTHAEINQLVDVVASARKLLT